MKKHILMTLLALLVSGGAFSVSLLKIHLSSQVSTLKYEVTVELKDNDEGGSYFTNKASKLLKDQFGFTVISTKTEGKAVTFLIEGNETSSPIKDVEMFFNDNGYSVMATKTID
ncbi:hypothetical protein [Parvicella tangerina]|uniref:Uncharacterized protein n=1 Tax=Parvicella tangerina TaxID=2829795 RepID=A0A916JK02_9FLAO|nr:hypothetical protein [Parvicella tangerina]CAG5078088.1 hypothetical protein CRYO30217_00571 [Parvicella tangerina]